MSWESDVRDCISQLPLEFTLDDMDRFVPRLHRRHPRNHHVKEKIRQQLQVLRDSGEVEFIAPGRYRRLGGPAGGLPIAPGKETSREELADILELRDATALQRGMFKRNDGPFAQDLLLFHHAETNPYGDAVGGDGQIVYVGQGMKGDQKLDSFNRVLANHLDEGVRVHFFVKESASGSAVRYEGPVVLDHVERTYREDEGRSVLEFHLIPDLKQGHHEAYGRAYAEVLEEDLAPRVGERQTVVSTQKRAIRDRAFSSHVRKQYNDRCSACGTTLAHPEEGWIDLQGAHVRSVASGGRDARNNGIALCSRHHWAFDHGIFSITDNYRILLHAKVADPHGELSPGAEIELPRQEELWPHAEYLKWHRLNWNLAA